MTLQSLADLIQTGLTTSNFTQSLKFDCGEDGVIVLKDKQAVLVDQDAHCTIGISKSNLEKLIRGDLNPVTGAMMGKLKLSGDMSVALKLKELADSTRQCNFTYGI